MIFMSVCGDTGFDAMCVVAQICEVGQHQVDSMHVCIWEHQPAVDKQQSIVLLDCHAVATYLA